MLLIVQADVIEVEGEMSLSWKIDTLPTDIRETFDHAASDVDFNLSEVRGRLGREPVVGELIAVTGELDMLKSRFYYGQVEGIEGTVGMLDEHELLELFGPVQKREKVGLWLWSINSHLLGCGLWDKGDPHQNMYDRTYGYRCGCGCDFQIHTGLVMWATGHDGCLPVGFTEKMRFLSIRGAYWRSLAQGTHEIETTVRHKWLAGWNFGKEGLPMDYEHVGTAKTAPPTHCNTWVVSVADFTEITQKWSQSIGLELKVPQVKGVKVGLLDEDPYKTVVTVTCTRIKESNADQAAEGSQEKGQEEGRSDRRKAELRIVKTSEEGPNEEGPEAQA